MGIWSELEGCTKIPHYAYGNCECGVLNKIAKMIEEERMHQFLMGLDDESFSTIRSQVLARNPLPSLDTIFNMVQQEEHHKRVMLGRDQRGDSVIAFTARESLGIGVKPTCQHCGKYRHDETGCFEIIGYPAS